MPIVDQFKDNDEALQFVEKLGEKIKANPEAFALSKVLEGKIQLDRYKNIEKTKVKIDMFSLFFTIYYRIFEPWLVYFELNS